MSEKHHVQAVTKTPFVSRSHDGISKTLSLECDVDDGKLFSWRFTPDPQPGDTLSLSSLGIDGLVETNDGII